MIHIILVLILFMIFLCLTVLYKVDDEFHVKRTSLLFGALATIFGLWFIILSVGLSVGPANTRSDLREFEAIRTTIAEQRADHSLSDLERVQLTKTIAEKNAWLAQAQFWATNPWTDLFYDQSVLKVQPIK